MSPSFNMFQQASAQAAQSVGSFIRRPMGLPPQQVGQGVHTPVILRASEALSSVLAQFDREQPIPVQPLQTSGIMGGSGDLSPPAVGDVQGATGPDPDTQAYLAQKAVEANPTQVATPQAYSFEFPPPPNWPQRPDVGQGGDRSPVPSYEQALQAEVASLQAELAACSYCSCDHWAHRSTDGGSRRSSSSTTSIAAGCFLTWHWGASSGLWFWGPSRSFWGPSRSSRWWSSSAFLHVYG